MRSFLQILMLSTALTLTGCTDSTQVFSSTASTSSKQSPASAAGYYKVGNPYQVAGVWYYPKEDYSYKEIGVASWYGPDFHNGITANGEMYDMNGLTAAHRTLPLPSMVRVTNLQNGRSLVLRVNDRGPFVNNRVIDVSMRAAQLLGFKEKGTTQVQVEVLPEESKKLKEELLSGTTKTENVTVTSIPKAIKDDADNNAEVLPKPIDKPQNLTLSSNYPRLANPPPQANGADSGLLVGSAPAQKASPFNDWDEDLSKTQAEKPIFEASVAPAKKEVSAPAQKIEPVNKPPVQMKKPEKPEQTVSLVSTGFYVQVGAFGSLENAEKMRDKVARYGNALIQPLNTGRKTLYRVRLGPSTAKKALETLDKVTSNGYSDARVVEEKNLPAAGKRLDSAF